MDFHKGKLDYDYITDGIYIGTNQCCQTHFDDTLKNKEAITADISLEENRLDAPFGIDFYVWMPIRDRFPPTSDQFEFGVSVIEKLVAMKKKIYIHCKNGHGRAPTLVAAYLVKSRNMTAEAALAFLKSKRASVHLSDRQKEALLKWSSRL